MKTINERYAILNEEIFRLRQQGWKVRSQTDTTCELTKTPPGCAYVPLNFLFVVRGGEEIILNIEVTPDGIIKHS